MSESDTHPRIRKRADTVFAQQVRTLAEDRKRIIAAMKIAIKSLSALERDADCDRVDVLIKKYEWALEELKSTDDELRTDSERMASITKLLKRML